MHAIRVPAVGRLSPLLNLGLFVAVFLCGHAHSAPPTTEQQHEFFEKEVRPLLAKYCFECHGADAEEPEGGLRMVSRESLLAGGDTGPAFVPGKPDDSLLIEAVRYSDRIEMPPDTKLKPDQVDVLRRWIEMGAPWPGGAAAAAKKKAFDLRERYQSHWCWRPVESPELPQVRNGAWPAEPLDYFVLSRLEAAGIEPNPPADRRTLIRRLSFDLTGLPPTPEEIEDFVQDSHPAAVDRLIDRLLASPHFGEAWGRHWLDLVRYAETLGHEFDYPLPQAWRYRDYVIRAFNNDVPYDQFVREQIAGDLIDPPRRNPLDDTNESILGTYSWLLGEMVHAPVDVRLDQANRIDNQIDVFGKTFLGLTIACARCHDHKFDAISTRDYYGLYGVLESSYRGEHFIDPHRRWERAAEQLAELQSGAARSLRRIAQDLHESTSAETLARRLTKLLVEDNSDTAWEDPALRDPQHPAFALRLLHEQLADKADSAQAARAVDRVRSQLEAQHAKALSSAGDYEVVFDFDDPAQRAANTTGWAFTPAGTKGGEVNVAGFADSPLVPSGILHSGRNGRRLVGVWRSPQFTLKHRNLYYRLAGQNAEVRLIIDGYTMIEYHQLLFGGVKFPVKAGDQWTWHRQSGDLVKYVGHLVHIEVLDFGDGWAAIDKIVSSNQNSPPPDDVSSLALEVWRNPAGSSPEHLVRAYAEAIREALAAFSKGTAEADQTVLLNWSFQQGLLDDSAVTSVVAGARKQAESLAAGLPTPPRVPALVEGSPVDEHVFIRGSHKNLGDVAPRGLLEVLRASNEPYDGSGRLRIADEVASPDNPLTSRVIVNRVWHHLLGRGIVPSVDNFGVLGQPPSHPELLDHLASRFMAEGWSLKQLIRSIVRSRTYQMSSETNPVADAKDPGNQLWHRAAVRRLSAESIRDALLAASGRLDRQMSGPSVPVYLAPFMQGRGRPRKSGPLDGNGRRTIYLEVRRNFLNPFWLAFDGPIPFTTIGRRNVSNVPAQALIMMNDPLVRQQAELMARQLSRAQEPDDVPACCQWTFQRLYGRSATADEVAIVTEFVRLQQEEYERAGQAASPQTIWADTIHALVNSKEFLFLR